MFEKRKLRKAIRDGNLAETRAILSAKPQLLEVNLGDYHGRPIELAVRCGHRAVIDDLVERGADLSRGGRIGGNMLFTLVYDGKFGLLRDWAKMRPEFLQETNGWSETLLHVAAQRGQTEIAAWLLEQGADVAETDGYGRTPLYYAEQNKYAALITLLKPLQDRALEKYKQKARGLGDARPSENWKKLDDHRIARVQDQPAIGYRVTEIFNFAAGERTRLYRNLETNAETVETLAFTAAAGAEIEAAQTRFLAAGGQLPGAGRLSLDKGR